MKIINVVSYILIILSIVIALYIILYFQKYSPEFLTHEQFYFSIAGITGSFFTALSGIWMNLSGKLMDFAKDLGEVKGKVDQLTIYLKKK